MGGLLEPLGILVVSGFYSLGFHFDRGGTPEISPHSSGKLLININNNKGEYMYWSLSWLLGAFYFAAHRHLLVYVLVSGLFVVLVLGIYAMGAFVALRQMKRGKND